MQRIDRLLASLALFVATIVGCTAVQATERSDGAVQVPQVRAGDRWTFRIVEGYRQKMTWVETDEVTGVAPGSITIAVRMDGPRGTIAREEVWDAPGVVRSGAIMGTETKRFEPALIRYRFPLTPGATWSQRVRDVDKPRSPYGDVSFRANVVGHERISTPAGEFDAVKIRYVYQLDDETLQNYPTQCEYVVWYSPAVGSAVKELRRSWSATKGQSPARIPGENAVWELTSFSRAE
jgi:hypothetical protein